MKDTRIEHIAQHLKNCFDGKPWYGISVMEKLDSIPWEVVDNQRYGSKSIAVLVQHMINWRVFVLRKLRGNKDFDIEINGSMDWSKVQIENNQEWQAQKKELIHTQMEIIQALTSHGDVFLKEIVPGRDYDFEYLVNGISDHDTYHLGQIALIYSELKFEGHSDSVPKME